jgi:Cu2+-exporting ATPase
VTVAPALPPVSTEAPGSAAAAGRPGAPGSGIDWDAFAVEAPDGCRRVDLAVEGITCAACMSTIEHGLDRLPGVTAARVNLTTRRLAVSWRPDATDAGAIVRRLERLGYRAHPFDPGLRSAEEAAESRALLRAMAVAGFAAMNVMLLSVSVWAGNATDIEPTTRDFFHWLSALIALPAAAYAGRPFFRSALRALVAGRTNMDVPIAIGITLTLMLSLWQTMRSAEEAYFDSAVMLLFFLLAGRFLDHDMRRRTRSVAENVAALRAVSARRIDADGTAREVPLSRLAVGDAVAVAPGDRVAVDGTIAAGRSDIDQSLITGETAPAAVGPGDRVYAGTLNLTGALTVTVSAAASGTLLDEVNRLLETAAQARSRYMRLADRVARHYAPVVHLAALSTFIGWVVLGASADHAVVVAVSVLIITCPCALALAVPAVQVVASGQLFRAGVLIHAGDAIERLAAVDTVVFDKTGTLTLPEAAIVAPDLDAETLAVAGRLGRASRHPLAVAVARAAAARAADIAGSGVAGADDADSDVASSDVQDADAPARGAEGVVDAREIPGAGIEATVDGRRCRLGSPEFCGVDAGVLAAARDRHPAASFVAVRLGDATPVLLPLAQALRPDAAAVVADLAARGYAIEILSGDRAEAVAAAAAELGVAAWQAGLKPADKIARLAALKAAGRRVLMVGDGLNDAPALAAAHVSLSPVTAVDLSQAAADAVFLGASLAPVPAALSIAAAARAAMVQNLWLSIVYNVVAVPIAVLGHVTPLLAALAMSGSSIAVTLNALRLRFGAAAGPTGEA